MGVLSGRQRMGVAALILGLSALLSRLMGLARDKIISWQFGAGSEADTYFAAFIVPDIINYLLAGGFMSITLIPLLAKGFATDEDDAWRFFSCVLFWMTSGAIILTAAGAIFARPLAALTAPGFSADRLERLAFFTRVALPGQIFFLSGACFTALLFLRRQFGAPAFAPLIYNGCIIFFGVCAPTFFPDAGMTGYCAGASIGAALGAFLLPFLVARTGGLRISFVWRHPWLRQFLFVALPLMLGQTVVMLDEQFLRVFGSMLETGGVSLLNYARRVAQVPVALFGQAIAVASYPFLARLLADGEKDRFNRVLSSAMTTGTQLIIPACLWMTASAPSILALIFQGGRFGPADTLACAPLTQCLLLAAPFWIIYMTLVRGYYALGDTLNPAIMGTIVAALSLPCYYFAATKGGAWAVAAVSAVSVAIYVLWLTLFWRKKRGSDAFRGLLHGFLNSFACSLPAALVAALAIRETPTLFSAAPFWQACAELSFSGICFAVVFFLLARFFAPELFAKIKTFVFAKKRSCQNDAQTDK